MDKNTLKIILIVVAIILTLTIVGVTLALVLPKDKDKNSNGTNSNNSSQTTSSTSNDTSSDTPSSNQSPTSSNPSSSKPTSSQNTSSGSSDYTPIDLKIVKKDSASALDSNKAHVIILSGQSNATGQSMVSFLEKTATASDLAEYKAGYNNVLINYYVDMGRSNNKFEPVTLGQGATREKFGPEVGIAQYLSKTYPTETFYIIKASISGAGIAKHFKEGDNEYNFLIKSIDKGFKILEDQGLTPELFAFCWMQGETDALDGISANDYYDLESDLFNRILTRYAKYASKNGVATIDAGISQFWSKHKIVNEHKQKYANEAQNRYFFDTQKEELTYKLENNDPSHYDSQAMIKLGKLFGKFIDTVASKK